MAIITLEWNLTDIFTECLLKSWKKKISWEFPDFPEVVLLKILGKIIF